MHFSKKFHKLYYKTNQISKLISNLKMIIRQKLYCYYCQLSKKKFRKTLRLVRCFDSKNSNWPNLNNFNIMLWPFCMKGLNIKEVFSHVPPVTGYFQCLSFDITMLLGTLSINSSIKYKSYTTLTLFSNYFTS